MTASISAASIPPGRQLSVFYRQLPFGIVAVLILLGAAMWSPQTFVDPMFFAGMVLALTATTLAIVVPWRRLPLSSASAIPLLDILAVAAVIESGVDAGYVLVLPVLWMSTVYGAPGATISVVGGTLAAWGTGVLQPGQSFAVDAQRILLLPIVLTAVASYVHMSQRRSEARRDLLGRQSALIQETLDDARHRQRLLDSVLNTIDVGVVVIDAEGVITAINRAHAMVVEGRLKVGAHVVEHAGIDGYAADGTTPLGTDGSPLVRAHRGQQIDRELTWWHSGEERTAFRISAAQLYGDADERVGAVVAYQDLTAEMAALAQREDFVSSVSHDLRTPLTSILGYLELAVDDPTTSDRVRSHLQVVERNAERLVRLISDLLAAARIRDGRMDLQVGEVDLSELVRDAVHSHSPWATSALITVTNRVDDPCPIQADGPRLAQVVDNVLSNAVKYSRPGDEVELSLTRGDGEVRLTVRDTGIGIAEAERERLFARFYRAKAVRQGAAQGSGLGLYISREIVEAHGGAIELTSSLDVGTTVEIRLPLVAAPVELEQSTQLGVRI